VLRDVGNSQGDKKETARSQALRVLHHLPWRQRASQGWPRARPPGAALAYALQFEADQRQLDTIGQWVKLNEPTPLTDIAVKSKKWYGAHWSMVKNNVLEMTPSKTKEDERQKDRRAVRRIPDGG
jgi:hypothetical protein